MPEIVATIKIVLSKRDEYLTLVGAHGKRCLATESETLQFDILVPHEEAATVFVSGAKRKQAATEAACFGVVGSLD